MFISDQTRWFIAVLVLVHTIDNCLARGVIELKLTLTEARMGYLRLDR